MFRGASDGAIDSLHELFFIPVTDFHVLAVDIIAVDERRSPLATETWRSSRESQSVWRSLRRLGTAGEKLHTQFPDLVGAGSPCRLP